MRQIAVAVILIVLAAAPAYAQEKPDPIKGAGNSSCADYVTAYKAYRPFMRQDQGSAPPQTYANYVKFEEWLQGLMFGLISGSRYSIKDYDSKAMQYWIYRFCQEHPTDLVATAGSVYFLEIGGVIPGMFEGEVAPHD